jgi:hypothetical protein
MRADVCSRLVSATRTTMIVLLALGVAACKTEKDADQPTILGVPAPTAYLGVEYYYNFGAYGGESILDYSLTNAPSWLALEGTSNKARQGIIMRGVPGLTGGSRGAADLGKNQGINLVTTDGQMAGVQPFDIEVKYNALSLETDKFREGDTPTIPDTRREHCELPDLETKGKHTFSINEYDAAGNVSGTKQITADTQPVAVRVILDQPSVTKVQVAFELTSEYDATKCDPSGGSGSVPQQQCDYSDANVGNAIIGKDIVALGSDSKTDKLLEKLDYLEYELKDDMYAGGVLTFEPGITECYIRLEVPDDTFAEPSEVARLTLTEVRSGLAGLGENNSGVRTNIVIDDNEPVITLKTTAGGDRDTLNVGGTREYVASLEGDRESAFKAKLSHTEDSTARLNTEFVIESKDDNDNWVENDELEFPVDTDEVPFRIRVKDSASGYTNLSLDDRFILLGLDEKFQRGRENYARAASENLLRISLNEQTEPLVLNPSGDGFVPTDFAIAHSGRAFVAGYDSTNNDHVLVRIYDQKGTLLQEVGVSDPGDELSAPDPVITTARRKVPQGNTKVDRFEFAVAYGAEKSVAGTGASSSFGGTDVVVTRYWYDTATNGGEYIRDWIIRTGTSADDVVRSVAMNQDTGYVMVAGETMGAWEDQTAAGGSDSFLQRIDTETDGANLVPSVAWTRQVGSSGDDYVAGVSTSYLSPLVFGWAENSVNGEPVLGGKDAFFYSASSKDSDLTVYQIGTDRDEEISDGIYAEGLVWLLGKSATEYSVADEDPENTSLVGTGLNSQAGFMLGYSTSGEIKRAFNLNDADDVATENLQALTDFDGDLVVAGNSDGDFTGKVVSTPVTPHAVVARVSLLPESVEGDGESEETPPFRNEWRYQLPTDNSDILATGNYRDDEISALTRVGSQWSLQLFSPEGVLLTQ